MNKGHTQLSQDERPINSVWWPHEGAGYQVGNPINGTDTVTKIEAYDESGLMAHIPWIAVFGNDGIVVRIPADQVSVHY